MLTIKRVKFTFIKVVTQNIHIKEMLQQLIDLSPKKKGFRSAIPEFDFKEKCLFCGEVANVQTEKKKTPNKRDIQVVRSFRTQDPIVKATEKRNDEWSEKVGGRIIYYDLIAAETRYHHTKCYLPYTNNRDGINSTSRNSIGRTSLLHKTEHSKNWCQYSIEDSMYQLNKYAGMQMVMENSVKMYAM